MWKWIWNANYDVGYIYGKLSENEIISIILISITISCIFNWKQIQLESLKQIYTQVNVLSYYIVKMAINYIEKNFVCIKIACI